MENLNKGIFWDYSNINIENEFGLKTYLTRIIQFGEFTNNDLENIKKHYKELNIPKYWKNYFNFYFKKYDIN